MLNTVGVPTSQPPPPFPQSRVSPELHPISRESSTTLSLHLCLGILSSFFPPLLCAPLAFQPIPRSFIRRDQITSAFSVILTFCKYIFDSFRVDFHVDVIYTNFAKAFDSINHDSLISLLSTSRFVNPLLSWLHSYLFNRFQYVKLFGTKSTIFTASFWCFLMGLPLSTAFCTFCK